LIDSFAESVIDKDQFTDRMNRTKARIADIDERISAQTSDDGRQARLRSVQSRVAELSGHLQNKLSNADWSTRREIIRALVQRIEIGKTKIAVVLRLPTDTGARASDPVMVTLSRA
jgi:site-specific DNA recombinase